MTNSVRFEVQSLNSAAVLLLKYLLWEITCRGATYVSTIKMQAFEGHDIGAWKRARVRSIKHHAFGKIIEYLKNFETRRPNLASASLEKHLEIVFLGRMNFRRMSLKMWSSRSLVILHSDEITQAWWLEKGCLALRCHRHRWSNHDQCEVMPLHHWELFR